MPYRDDSQRLPFDPQVAANRIAQEAPRHDSFQKHVVEKGEFQDLGITSRADYAKHIERTMLDSSTVCLHSHSDRTIFYNENSNTFVAYDPNNLQNGGTCYRPEGGPAEGWNQLEHEFSKDNLVYNGSPDRSRIVTGGYEALYQGQTQARAQPELQTPLEPTAQTPDLTRVNLPSYAEAEHGYKVEPKPLGILLTKNGEELRAVRAEDGTWSYLNPQEPNDKGDIVAFAASRGAGTPQQAEASVSNYLSRNPGAYEASVSDASRATTRDKGADPTDF